MNPSKQTHLIITGLLLFISLVFSACKQQPTLPPGFEIHPDFQLELVASEPLVMDPVDLQFDEHGRAFVLEMPGYPLRDTESRLILLKDTDGDGQYDKRHIYADKLLLASSFMPYKGGMLVAAPPKLLFLSDTDGDDVADDYQVIMSGFSAGNLQHNYNGLTYGLDNWIYAANGGNSGKPYFEADSSSKLDLREDDFRFRLEDQQLARVGQSSGGFGLAFDNWGRMYETHNLEHVSQLVFESRYIEGLPVSPSHSLRIISDHEENGLSRIYPIGEQDTRVNHPEQSGYFSGSCGITFYGGGAFPEGFNDHLFVADVVLNLVHLDILSTNGAVSKASRSREKVEFIASTDRSFRPVNLRTGADGALYLIDIHREVIEHPEWIPDEIEANLDLNAGKEKGRIYRIRPKTNGSPSPTSLDRNKLHELVASLGHRNQWRRTTAQRLLVELNDEASISLLEELAKARDNPLARLHALWTLEGLGKLETGLLSEAFDDPAAGLRENAIKMAELRLNQQPEILEQLLRMTADSDARVRMQAALTLGTLDDAHYQAYSSAISDAAVKMLSEYDHDIWTAMAVASAVQRQAAQFCSNLLAQQEGALSEGQLQVALSLARLIGKQNDPDATYVVLQSLAEKGNMKTVDKTSMIEALAEGWETAKTLVSSPKLLTALESIEKTRETVIIRAAGHLRKALGLPVSSNIKSLIAAASRSLMDKELPVEERLALLQLMALGDFDKREALLYKLLDNKEALVLQKEALAQLWNSDKASIGTELHQRWPSLGPEARRLAGNILLYKSYHHDLLLSALEDGSINAGELNLDLERRRVLLFSQNDQIKARAEALFSDAGVVQRKEAIAQMRPALSISGDVAKGMRVYQTHCAQCHQHGEMGKNVGPVLTEISRKSKESLLYDILDPNAAVDTRYINHRVSTDDGHIYIGMIHRETDTEVSLRMMGGAEKTIAKKDIKTFSSMGISMMPEGLESSISQEDMADLLAFLQQSI